MQSFCIEWPCWQREELLGKGVVICYRVAQFSGRRDSGTPRKRERSFGIECPNILTGEKVW